MSEPKQALSRRRFLQMAAATGGVLALAACAAPAAPGGAAPAQEAITLSAWIFQGPPVETINELIRTAFNRKHSDVTVNFNYITGDYAERVYAGAAAQTLGDIFFSADLFVVPFAKNDVSLDLLPFTEADTEVDLDDVFPSMLGLGTFDNKVQMLPSALDVVSLYYNKTLFEEAGAELPSEDWTWQNLVAECQKITALEVEADGTPRYWGLSNATWNWWATVYPWIVGYGGGILDVENKRSTWTDPSTLEGIQAYADLWAVHNIAQPVGLDVGGDAFQLGRAALYTHIQGVRPGLRANIEDRFEWDVQVMPTMPDGRRRTGMGTWGMSVYALGKHLELSYDYVKQMITPEVQLEAVRADAGIPLLQSVANDPSWMEGLNTPPTNFMAYIKGADDAILPVMDYPGDCGSFYAGMVSSTYQSALEAVIRGVQTAEEAFAGVDSTIQPCLDENM